MTISKTKTKLNSDAYAAIAVKDVVIPGSTDARSTLYTASLRAK